MSARAKTNLGQVAYDAFYAVVAPASVGRYRGSSMKEAWTAAALAVQEAVLAQRQSAEGRPVPPPKVRREVQR